jgi:E3 ubiquitin-protein ligase CHFR
VVMIDYSKVKEEEENAKKRQLEEISLSKEELAKKEADEKVMKQKINSMADQFDCGICYLTMHQAVTLMPCLHTFCGGCFSDWMAR